MLRRLFHRRRSASAALATLLIGLWVAAAAAPCAIAAAPTATNDRYSMPNCDMERGAQPMLDCDLPEANTPVASSPDASFAPALLAVIPATTFTSLPRHTAVFRNEAARPPPLPVYLTQLALLL